MTRIYELHFSANSLLMQKVLQDAIEVKCYLVTEHDHQRWHSFVRPSCIAQATHHLALMIIECRGTDPSRI